MPPICSPRIHSADVTARNRIWVSPMCQYSVFKENGAPTDWHLVHLGSRAVGGAGLIIAEATAVEPRGRISAQDLGLWNDLQAEAFVPIARFMAGHGAVPAIQIAHAGRKARVPDAVGPSPVAFSPEMATPREMTHRDIVEVLRAFRDAAAARGRSRFSGARDSRGSRLFATRVPLPHQ